MHVKSYKVLFADDEYWTREKMARIIPWEKYSLEFLKPASDGEEVLERLSEEKPDILITDINMPYVNGVELLKKVHTEYPELITFVISGYDDFEYVRDSFLSGSIHYPYETGWKNRSYQCFVKGTGTDQSEAEQKRRGTAETAGITEGFFLY